MPGQERQATCFAWPPRCDRGPDRLDQPAILESLRRRVDALGVAEPNLQRSGEDRILVELPGVTDPDEAQEVIGRTAQLEFLPVLAVEAPPTTRPVRGQSSGV